MTTRLVVGAISAEANRVATNLMHHLLRDETPADGAAVAWPAHRPSPLASKTSLLGFTRMLSSAAEQSGRSHLGLDMACTDMGPSHSIFGGLFLYAPTVGSALESLARYFSVVQTGTRVELVQNQGSARLIYDIHNLAGTDRLHDAAYTLGKLCRSLRRGVGESWALDHVTLAAPTPRLQAPYQRVFRAPVVFDAQHTALYFSPRLLSQPIASADPLRYADFCAHLEQLMPGGQESELLEDALRAWMVHAVRWGRATLDYAATDFGVTPRTMQRRLKEQNISFQPLLAQVRMETAQHMLSQSNLAVMDIAEQLGFSETSAFTRAFRSYTRQSPSAFRQSAFAARIH
ncbi:AraC family transcriptional regulator [Ottowia thiooxydans]|uniref:AraC family transcriptional regulator n=1 Tax=Ottowia thiooxydans TaxID=219182 RepID=UPI000419C15D|nr:AraC family transcriptional regulator [Ottowia thiooxydans]